MISVGVFIVYLNHFSHVDKPKQAKDNRPYIVLRNSEHYDDYERLCLNGRMVCSGENVCKVAKVECIPNSNCERLMPNTQFLLCILLIATANASVFESEEDKPLLQSGTLCGDQTCPENQRCEIPSVNSECDDENECTLAARCVPIPVGKPKCGENEEVKECGSVCEPTCESADPECGIQCLTNVCQCKSGFYRDSSTKKCVELASCSKCSLECPGDEKCEFVDTSCDNEGCKRTEVCAVPASRQ